MAYVKDLWFSKRKVDGRVEKVPTKRNGTGKRWLAVWQVDGREPSKAFSTQAAANRFARKQEVDVERGDYIDPKAGRERFGDIAKRWLGSRSVNVSSRVKYDAVWRNQVEPVFGHRPVKSIKPSEVQKLLTKLLMEDRYSWDTVDKVRHIIQAVLELAVADGLIKNNVGKSHVISIIRPPDEQIEVWSDAQVWALIDAHPDVLRLLPIVAAGCGLRQGELFGLSVSDIDFDAGLVRVRRQIKAVKRSWVYSLPKGGKERVVPLSEGTAAAIRVHLSKYRPLDVTLSWSEPGREQVTHPLLFRHPDRTEHIKPDSLDRYWNPALVVAGIIGPPAKNARGRKTYAKTGREGRHALRHHYASTMLASGVNIKELATYLGHTNAAFTLRVYAHLLPDSYDRARQAIDQRLFRPRAVKMAHGT